VVRIEVDEAEKDWQPTGQTLAHLQECPSCRTFFSERSQLRQMVAGLEPVTAPADFNFRLRAKLSEESSLRHKFGYAGFVPVLRFAAITSLALVLGLAAWYRISPRQTSETTAVNEFAQSMPTSTALSPPADPALANDENTPSEVGVDRPTTPAPRRKIRSTTAANKNRSATQVFSSTPTTVIQQSVANAAQVFPIDSSYESLKLSLDDGSGTPRTISLPSVSFGSQRVLAGEQTSMVKTSAKGVW
jgi:hypothetical protein